MTRRIHSLGLALVLTLAMLPLGAYSATHEPAASLSPMANQIRKELVTLPWYSVFDHFEFQVDGDKVTLRGSVIRPTLKTAAERVVARVEGVSEVENLIEVLPVSNYDDRLRLNLYRAVYGDSVLGRYALNPIGPIRIIVENGHVTLKGAVSRKMEKDVASVRANAVPGVFSVTNDLHVDSPRS